MRINYANSTSRRNKKYSITTLFIEEDGKTVVRKTPNTVEAKKHIEQMSHNYDLLVKSVCPDVHICKYTRKDDYIDFEYIKGETILQKIYTAYDEHQFETVLFWFDKYNEFLNTVCENYTVFHKTEEFFNAFGNFDFEGKKSFCPANIDLLPANVIIKDGKYHIIDYEWVFDFPIPVDFVLFRAIAGYYDSDKRNIGDYQTVLDHFGLSPDVCAEYTKMTRAFEKAAYAFSGSENIPKLRFLKNMIDVESLKNERQDLVQGMSNLQTENNNLKNWIENLVLETEIAKKETEIAKKDAAYARSEMQRQMEQVNVSAISERMGLVTQLEIEKDHLNSLQQAYDGVISIGTKGHIKLAAKGVYRKLFRSEKSRVHFKNFAFHAMAPFIHKKQLYKQWKNAKMGNPTDQTAALPVNQEISSSRVDLLDYANTDAGYIKQVVDIPNNQNIEYIKKATQCVDQDKIDVKAIAFYLPQYHPFPQNDAWWGEGFTEWTNVAKTMPLFSGHFQPRLPADLGYYDLRIKENIKKQMDIAKMYGISGFAMYYYWFDGTTLMNTPLDIIMQNKELDLPFCLCWANENWTRTWDGEAADVLMEQKYSEESMMRFAQDILPYIKDERYIKVNGKQALIIYNPGEIPNFEEIAQKWKAYFKENDVPITLLCVDRPNYHDQGNQTVDAYIEFPPHSVVMQGLMPQNCTGKEKFEIPDFSGIMYDYNDIVDNKYYLNKTDSKMYKGVMLAWDNTARRGNRATIFNHFSVKKYKEWLDDIIEFTDENFVEEDKVVFINAWNEWAEGTYLEPDRAYGYACLEATKQALLRNKEPKREIIYVSHDAFFNGAQVLSVNIVRQLKEVFGYDVYVLLKRGGELENEFKKYAKQVVNIETDIKSQQEMIGLIKRWGIKKAICNTVVSGDVLGVLSDHGVECISLIHEMKEVIENMYAVKKLNEINQKAKKIVFPSRYVEISDEKIVKLHKDKVVIMPQGLFTVNPYADDEEGARSRIFEKLGFAKTDKMVLGVGTADYRKGIDLFVECAKKVADQRDDVHFVWIGAPNIPDFEEVIIQKCKDADLMESKKILFVPPQRDINEFYIAADVFLLTSREDPFPCVVAESMNVGVPVIAFAGCGGFEDIIGEKTGALVPKFDTDAMVHEIIKHIDGEQDILNKPKNCKALVQNQLNFIQYVESLLLMLDQKVHKVSVVIPNYNYAKYLDLRIQSVLNQTYPIYEILLLDDCSTDHSMEVLKKYQAQYPLKIRVIQNQNNSGNVFLQWEKGLKLAKGDYVWIAEADDFAQPDFVEKNMEKFLQDEEVVLSYAQSMQVDSDGSVIGTDYLDCTKDVENIDYHHDFIIDAQTEITSGLSAKNTILNVSAVLFKNRDFSKYLSEAKKFSVAGDWMFYVKLLEDGGKVGYVRESLNAHRRHQNSVTLKLNNEKHFCEIVKMQDYVCEHYEQVNVQKVMDYRKEVKEYLGV
ncbi:MAG: glycoside hydrolase family 99-like domain-containing protein [Christensenellaceae bacterium]